VSVDVVKVLTLQGPFGLREHSVEDRQGLRAEDAAHPQLAVRERPVSTRLVAGRQ
jgi:hypothetical protein